MTCSSRLCKYSVRFEICYTLTNSAKPSETLRFSSHFSHNYIKSCGTWSPQCGDMTCEQVHHLCMHTCAQLLKYISTTDAIHSWDHWYAAESTLMTLATVEMLKHSLICQNEKSFALPWRIYQSTSSAFWKIHFPKVRQQTYLQHPFSTAFAASGQIRCCSWVGRAAARKAQ